MLGLQRQNGKTVKKESPLAARDGKLSILRVLTIPSLIKFLAPSTGPVEPIDTALILKKTLLPYGNIIQKERNAALNFLLVLCLVIAYGAVIVD